MFHIGVQFSLTEYALERSGAVHCKLDPVRHIT